MSLLQVSGFASGNDPHIPNELVELFILESFGEKQLKSAQVAGAIKSDLFITYINLELARSLGDRLMEFFMAGRFYRRYDQLELIFTDRREDYEQLECLLEGVSDLADLQHLYKVRAFAGEYSVPKLIELGSFATEHMEAYDYLTDCGLSTSDDLRRMYILGTVAHEIAHRIYHHYQEVLFEQYQKIVVAESKGSLRLRYVTDYVALHQRVYKTDPERLLGEDFVESVRLYITNPNYLLAKYPKRFYFFKYVLPFIRPGWALQLIKPS
jgi:hypothetical protein